MAADHHGHTIPGEDRLEKGCLEKGFPENRGGSILGDRSALEPLLVRDGSLIDTSHQCFIPWCHERSDDHTSRLYEIAKSGSWNAAQDIAWPQQDVCGMFPIGQDENPFVGFPSYDELALDHKREVCWIQHGLDLSDILHGEQGALIISAQLVAALPDSNAKLFASTQVFDEARHVEFFSRYLESTVGYVCRPTSQLEALISRAIRESSWDIKLIICQLVIESLAMARFQEIKRTTGISMLRDGLDRILRDEARHVSFGANYLKSIVSEMSPSEREARSRLVLDCTTSLASSLNSYTRIASLVGWDVHALRRHLRSYRARNRNAIRDPLRQLLVNLELSGLLTSGVKSDIERLFE